MVPGFPEKRPTSQEGGVGLDTHTHTHTRKMVPGFPEKEKNKARRGCWLGYLYIHPLYLSL